MKSRSCRWLIVSALVIAAPAAWAQCKPVSGAQNIATLKFQAVNGKASAQCSLGVMYKDGKGVPQDYAQAALWYRKAAEQGYHQAQYHLGLLYDSGHGIPQDYLEAARWYRKAADQGDADAQSFLGFLYANGHGVPQDDTQALTWCRKADEQDPDSIPAKGCLYMLYASEMDRRSPEDYPEAVTWFREAANQGYDLAEDVLGRLYEKGQEGVPQDYAQAAFWYRKAAAQDNAKAQIMLAALYHDGAGVPKDYAEAYFWFDLASAAKDTSVAKEAAEDRDTIVAPLLAPTDISRAQERARKWFEAHSAKP